jgi:hypothetical protein
MPKKTFLLSFFGVLVIGGTLYFSSPQKSKAPVVTSPALVQVSQDEKIQQPSMVPTSTEPSKDASTEEIVDYLVDGVTDDETSATEKIIDDSVATSTADVAISTNF